MLLTPILRVRSIPHVSPRRHSVVLVVSHDDGVVAVVPHPEGARLGGLLSAAHFAAGGIEEIASVAPEASLSRHGIAPPYNPDGSLQVAFAELMHVRRRLPPCGSLLRAVALPPDAATALSASAAALAAARLTRADGQLMHEPIRSMSLEPGAEPHLAAAEAFCGVAYGARASASVPAATQRTTRAAARGGGMAGALARLRREAEDPAAA